MPAIYVPRRVADMADVVANGGIIPDSLLPDASSTVVPSLGYYLRFPGGSTQSHVDVGPGFWAAAPGTAVGHCLWDAIFRPAASGGGGYAFSDGYGGAHLVLWGISGNRITGNMNSSAGSQSFTGNYPLQSGEWAHHALGLGLFITGTPYIFTYVNGVPDSMVPFAGTRQTGGPVGDAYIGGSDHINFAGDICYMRAWDFGVNAFSSVMCNSFIPERFPKSVDAQGNPVHFYMPFHSVGQLVDYGIGTPQVDGTLRRHHGALFDAAGTGAGGTYAFGPGYSGPGVPYWVQDDNSPFMRSPTLSFASGAAVPTPLAVPSGCKAFDSFGRANQTHFTGVDPSLGSIEGGSLAPRAWTAEYSGSPTGLPRPYGILGGYAVSLATTLATAHVDLGSPDMDVRVEQFPDLSRHPGTASICFRKADKDNFLSLWYQPDSYATPAGGGHVYLYVCAGGTMTNVGGISYAVPNGLYGWLRVVTAGTTITTHASPDGVTWTQIGQETGFTTYQSATRAGLANSPVSYLAVGLFRVKQFIAY